MKLPTTKTEATKELKDQSILIYGPPKIGKSTFLSEIKDNLILATEPGLKNLSTYNLEINSWQDFLSACNLVATGDHKFTSVSIDTIDALYKYCTEFVCEKKGVEHEGDIGHGKGYAMVKSEFQRAILKLASLPYALRITSHSREFEQETRTGKITKVTTTLPQKAKEFVSGFVDIILLCDTVEVEKKDNDGNPSGERETTRIMRTKPTKYYDAGDRTGRLPDVLKLGYSELEKAWWDRVSADDNSKKQINNK